MIAIDSIPEVCARDEDLAKGIDQAKLIKEYAEKNLEDTLNRAFGINRIEVDNLFTCVISKNNLGTSELADFIPVITEDILINLFTLHKGNLKDVINSIEQKDFLPEEGKDYGVLTPEIEYAGYRFKFPAITLELEKDKTMVELFQKIGRNDPCPCGRINPSTGKPMKYKKCCDK
ncbi:MAG: hypothetical protein VR67_18005 [Peptococcaceae bacterium BRH_c8a]|nr:MAG: hypothetical protein VR67_18005 [Peptococcaceae bacterium BRH_c8a]